MTGQPVVTTLLTTPVKGFTMNSVEQIQLDSNGALGDRDFFVVDAEDRLFSITRTGVFASYQASFDPPTSLLRITSPTGQTLEGEALPGDPVTIDFWESRDVAGHVVAGRWSDWLSEIARRPVRLVRTGEPGAGFDETAVTVLSAESVAELGRSTGTQDIDIRRFRMLINVAGVMPYEEEAWSSRTLSIGSTVLQMHGPVPRCNATTRDPDSGKRDLQTLRLIDQARGMQPNDFGEGLNLGAYATIVEPGVITVGDVLELS
jgi:uncharacterized protein YcbX